MKQGSIYQKPFSDWHKKKAVINRRDRVHFNEREIWWTSVGVNVGYEIDGKGEYFARPVLVLKKVSTEKFIGLPITSRKKRLPGYFIYKKDSIVFEQVKVFDARRLLDRKETVPSESFQEVVGKFLNYTNPLAGVRGD